MTSSAAACATFLLVPPATAVPALLRRLLADRPAGNGRCGSVVDCRWWSLGGHSCCMCGMMRSRILHARILTADGLEKCESASGQLLLMPITSTGANDEVSLVVSTCSSWRFARGKYWLTWPLKGKRTLLWRFNVQHQT